MILPSPENKTDFANAIAGMKEWSRAAATLNLSNGRFVHEPPASSNIATTAPFNDKAREMPDQSPGFWPSMSMPTGTHCATGAKMGAGVAGEERVRCWGIGAGVGGGVGRETP